MKERPFFTAALVFSSPSLVPSFAAFTNFCIFEENKRNGQKYKNSDENLSNFG